LRLFFVATPTTCACTASLTTLFRSGRVVLGPIGVVGRHHVNSEPGRPARDRVEKRDGALLAFLAAFASLVSVTAEEAPHPLTVLDRKSTRLNSSHVKISYAVFCLKK